MRCGAAFFSSTFTGGGGGATRKLVNCVFGSASVKSSGIMIATMMPTIWAINDTKTVQVLLVFPTPSTNVCSNMFVPHFQNHFAFFSRGFPAAFAGGRV